MQEFFHAETSIYAKRFKTVNIAVLLPLAAVCIICAAMIIFNMHSDGDAGLIQLMVYIVIGCVAFGMTTVFAGAYIAEKKARRHARFTYFDILPKGMVYSRYAGEHYLYGERTIYRRLYYIPFEGLASVSRDAKDAPAAMEITGEIREFFMPSDCLGYHIDGDGELRFDNSELNERFFTVSSKLKVSNDFGSTKRLVQAVQYYIEQFRNVPEKKPFNISDYVKQKSKRPMRTSNPILDSPRFDRKW
ncbi:MAG: hypothetical protein IJZ95_01380 [Oscillospiraceae bacterium]|nr:hypothetical protein [Oscillospiraceae bacterium]